MARERIEKTLVILEEDEVRRILAAAQRNDPDEIYLLVTKVITRKVEEALRRRCG